jgi:TRAP-type C4-dicarboxylate transport system permease small subunit
VSLKRSGLGAQAVLWGALGFALLAWLGVTIAALVIDGDWQHIFLNAAWGFFIFMPIVFLVILVMLLIAFVNLPRRRQILLRAGDPLMTHPAPQQPDPALALHAGETLAFGWHQPASTTLTGLLVGPLLGAFVALSGEVMVFSTIPAFGSTSLNPFYDAFGDTLGPPPTPTPLDWIAAAFPIAFGLLVLSLSLWATLAGRRARITADDRGITYQRSFQRTRFIPWNDIHVLVRRSQTKDGSAGDYYVWGSDYGIVFTVNPKITVPASSQRGARQQNSGFIYEGGYETYIRDAARLLATISARSFVPLHITRVGERANQGMSRRFPLLTLTLEDIQNAPLATAPLQPDMSAAPHVAEIKAIRGRSRGLDVRVRGPRRPL